MNVLLNVLLFNTGLEIKMAAAETNLQWKFVLLLLVRIVILFTAAHNTVLCAAVNNMESQILKCISRRQSQDVYFFTSTCTGTYSLICNNGSKNTYLISENQCVKEKELFTGCGQPVVPAQSVRPTTIARLDSSKLNVTRLLVADNTAKNRATFKFNETDQLVNSSVCHVSTLEVYRGRDQAVEIRREGFSLKNNGNIEMNTDQLGYSLEDYMGELYRMTLTCSGGGLPESGCLFFKVIGISNITNAKFNCTVPGTLYECNITTLVTTASTLTDSTSDSTTTTLNITVTLIHTNFYDTLDTNYYLYVLAGLGGGILVLTFCTITVYICFCLHVARRKRKVGNTFTADNVYTTEDDEQPQQQNNGESIQIQENDLRTTSVLSDSLMVSEDVEHVYAVLEQTYMQQPTNIPQSNETMLTESLIETEPRYGFQYITNHTGLTKQSAMWTSAQHSIVGPKPRHENFELVQIYDNVTIESEGRTVAVTDNGPSCTGNCRKHSLPANIGGHQRSNASEDYSVSNESDKNEDSKKDDSMPIYSQPDMNEKRKERQKKREQKEQEERMAALQEVSSFSSPPLPQLTGISSSRQQENEPPMETDSGAVVDKQQQIDTDLKFGKNFGEQNNQDDKVPMGKDECVYDEPISLNLVPKKSTNITQRKQKGKDGEEEV